MPGGKGQSDLYEVDINTDGSFGRVKNLEKINTEGRETFPFISQNGTLYFASDAYPGLGGLDIFKAQILADDLIKIENLPAPVNSRNDDFGLIINDNTGTGYFSSNRPGMGGDDIYSFQIKSVKGTGKSVTNGQKPSKDTAIYERDSILIVQLPVKVTNPLPLSVSDNDNWLRFDNDRVLYTTGDDLVKLFSLKPIFFDTNKWSIKGEDNATLDKIVKILLENMFLKIEIRSFADERASSNYNLWLTQQRAEATAAYLKSKGIDAGRLKAKGMGVHPQLTDCTKEDCYQRGRKSEFIIVE